MDERLRDLYKIPPKTLPQDLYLMDLAEACAHMEERVRGLIEELPASDRELMESYLDMRDELEFQSVKTDLRFGKYIKQI